MSFVKQLIVVTNTIRETEILALLDSWVTTHLLSSVLLTTKLLLFLFFLENMTCLYIGVLRIYQVFSLSCKIGHPVVRQMAVLYYIVYTCVPTIMLSILFMSVNLGLAFGRVINKDKFSLLPLTIILSLPKHVNIF
jgi:hypothetical protein